MCDKCGTFNTNDYNFCPYCGKSLTYFKQSKIKKLYDYDSTHIYLDEQLTDRLPHLWIGHTRENSNMPIIYDVNTKKVIFQFADIVIPDGDISYSKFISPTKFSNLDDYYKTYNYKSLSFDSSDTGYWYFHCGKLYILTYTQYLNFYNENHQKVKPTDGGYKCETFDYGVLRISSWEYEKNKFTKIDEIVEKFETFHRIVIYILKNTANMSVIMSIDTKTEYGISKNSPKKYRTCIINGWTCKKIIDSDSELLDADNIFKTFKNNIAIFENTKRYVVYDINSSLELLEIKKNYIECGGKIQNNVMVYAKNNNNNKRPTLMVCEDRQVTAYDIILE
jgi:hypothetical protein